MTDPGPWIHNVPLFACLLPPPPLPASVRLPTDESCQVPPQEKCVCVCLCVTLSESESLCLCVYVSTLMATLAVMCLMEDKQHSLRQDFTA